MQVAKEERENVERKNLPPHSGVEFPRGDNWGGEEWWTEEMLPLLHLLLSAPREAPEEENRCTLFLIISM